uniref:Uncharacterized protein n=1 Tax=Timema shepardi TaxID=629360 RepID=A0A7R9AZ48_TIMSH|nr:unnamed protein product [Timema shepardi]
MEDSNVIESAEAGSLRDGPQSFRNKFMMLPWVVLAFMLAIGILITIIWTAVVFFIDGFVLSGVLTLVIGFIGLAVYVYLWMVVYSYFQLLMEEDGRGPYVKPMSYS